MPKYKVLWNEWTSCSAEVEAEDEDEAYFIVKNVLSQSDIKRHIIDWTFEDIAKLEGEENV